MVKKIICLLCFCLYLQEQKELTWIKELFQFHVARVKDIELLTALSFFHNTNLSVSEILQLKTFIPSSI